MDTYLSQAKTKEGNSYFAHSEGLDKQNFRFFSFIGIDNFDSNSSLVFAKWTDEDCGSNNLFLKTCHRVNS